MEKAIKDLDNEIAEMKKQTRKSLKLQDRLSLESQIRDLEAKRNKQRFDLYSEQDKVDERKDALITETQGKLKQNVKAEHIFTIIWRVV